MDKKLENKLASNYWINKLKLYPIVNDSPLALLETKSVVIKKEELKYFDKLTANNEVVEFTVLFTIYNVLLQRYFETGLFIASPNLIKKDKILLYKFQLNKENTLKESLNKAKEEIQEVLKYSNFDEGLIRRKGALKNYASFGFLYNVSLHNDNYEFPFVLKINKKEEGLIISISYDENFKTEYVSNHFLENIKSWLLNIENYINEDVNKISIITEEEKEKVLFSFNNTKVEFSKDKTIVDLFEEQVEKTPDNIAVVFEGKQLTYKELNDQSNQTAQYFRETYAIQPDDLIGVKLDRSEQLLITILGILKSGAAYVPIDINYPQERINYIEEDSNCKTTIDINELNKFSEVKNKYSSKNLQKITNANQLAYVIYTSGTTGNPKGVMIEHQNAVALIHWAQEEFNPESFDIVYAATSHCFDLSVFEMFYPLSVGKKIKILDNALEIGAALNNDQKILLNTVPSSIRNILDEGFSLENVSVINLAGEPFPVDIANRLLKTNAEIRNLYGPSEDTTYSTCYQLSSENAYRAVPIGKPITNTQAYILDDELQLVPAGIIGKLYLSGDGVAKGYLNQPELTLMKFLENPFSTKDKMYDTGDLAKWMPDGNIAFFGRKDHQVKLRGYRIELGEIENAIFSFSESIQQAVVAIKKNKGSDVLVGYYVENSTVDKSELKVQLQKQLPAYMLPTFLVRVANIPLTPNGKVNKDALPEIEAIAVDKKEYVAPIDSVEKALVQIWEQTLGISPIGINDHFFELGGHSLMISQIINAIYKNLHKTVQYKMFYANPTIRDLRKALKNQDYLSIPVAPFCRFYPLTASQYRLWILSQLEGGSLAYNMPFALKLIGSIDIDKFEESFKILIERHEILRTCFKPNEAGEVSQYIIPSESFSFKIQEEDFTSFNNQEDAIFSYLQEKSSIAFDLEQAPLIRSSLVKLNQAEHLFFLSMHHIIGDGWSMELLVSEVVKIYNSLTQGVEIALPEISIQYKDYAVWLTEELQQEKNQHSKEFWLQLFEGEIPVLDLPSFKRRPLVQTYNGDSLTHEFSKEFLQTLSVFSKENNATLFMTLMSGIKALLYKYSGQQDIIVGTPIAGREHPDLENQIGLYINTLAIRTQFGERNSFLEVLNKEKQTLLEAYQHQSYPFDDLVGKLNLKRDMSRSALFDVMVVLQNQGQLKSLVNEEQLIGLQIENYEFRSKTSQFDVSFIFIEREEGLSLNIQYNTDIYDVLFIKRMFSHLEILITEVINNPSQVIEEIEYLPLEERNQIIEDFNDTKVDYPKDKTIVDLFEEQVEKTPNNVAVIFEENELTYKALNEQANRLGSYLREEYSIEADDLIGIKLDRSERIIVTILGILKSGAAYVPIDLNYPQERIEYIEKDSRCKVIIDSDFLSQFDNKQDDFSSSNLLHIQKETDLAYIIYTSGTTGNPKGVMVEHRNAVELINWSKTEYDVSKFDIVYAVTSYCFDLSVYEFFFTLATGKTLRVLRNALEISTYVNSGKSTLLNTVPSVVRKLLEDKVSLQNIKVLNMAGEVLPSDIIEQLPLESIEVRNLYGPSEDTTYSTRNLITSKNHRTISIGSPISNTQIWILNELLCPAPVGVLGKIYISGAGVTRGYLNKPELTSEKFISNPFVEGTRMYDTGDLGRWLPDGNIEFLGRKDHQVKIRGYRIELGEIETSLLQYSTDLKQVVVDVKEVNNEQGLVAYYVCETELDKALLRTYLQGKLPEYMVPSFYIEIESLPLNANGKIDRKALPSITGADFIRKEYVVPRNETEQNLAVIWQELLSLDQVGITDNFFELGGHSLIVAQVVNRVQKQLNKSISFKDFFSNPTIEALGRQLGENEYSAIPLAPFSESYPLTHSQNRLWLLSQLEGGNEAYQISGAVILCGNVDELNFTKAFNQIVERHEILRTFFKKDVDGVLKQFIVPNPDFQFAIETRDFSHQTSPYNQIQAYIEEKDNLTYNLTEAPLFRASLLKKANDKFVFYLSIHHLICDGWSLKVLTAQILESYDALQIGEVTQPESSVQYKDYAIWQIEEQKKERYQTAKEFWIKQFEDTIPAIQLPGYAKRPFVKTYYGNQFRHAFSTELFSKLKSLSKDAHVTLFAVLMTSVKTLLSRYSNQDDIVIGTPVAGREHPDLEDQVGLYINTLALRTLLNSKESFSKLLQREGKQLLEAYEQQNFQFDTLVEQLKISRDTSRSPLFDIMMVLQNQHQIANFSNNFSSDFVIEEFQIDRKVSPFDLVFTFIEKESLHLEMLYNSDLYTSDFIEGIVKHLEHLFSQIVETPEMLLEEIDLVCDSEKETLLDIFNATDVLFDKEKTIIDLFAEQVIKTPQNKAIAVDGKSLSYIELDELSNKLANHLIHNHHIAQHDLIAVKLERGEHLIISLLAILKTGAAYVPIDINYPENRIKDILEDVSPKTVIDDAFLNDSFLQNGLSSAQPKIKIESTDLAYIIYTSGSTGKPKGVMIMHQSLVNLCFWHKETYNVNEVSKGTLFSGVAFDASVWEIYPYLISGATLYPIQKDEIRLQTGKLVSFLKENKITHSYLPSKVCQDIIAENGLELSTIILTGGESLNYSINTSLQVYNNYGPTESTVVTTYYDCKEALNEKVSIGKPIANTRVYILSENLKLQPIGVIGELCVSGIGLSKGYLHQPELTSKKFIENPFLAKELLYKTGDLARWLPDGNLEFIGRKDNQVKIRGNRVELSEIEHVIRKYDAKISAALVLVKEVNHEQVIVVYYTTSAAIDKKELRDYLKEQLPDYMVPSYYVTLETLPLNANGKVDTTKLPAISEADVLKKEYVAPSNETETKIAAIWQELLGHQIIGVNDDFFEFGGHSLLLTKLLSEYQKTFKISVDLKTLYANTSLKSHAALLNGLTRESYEIEKAAIQEYYDLSSSQMRYWLLYKIQGKSREFNIYNTFDLPDNLNITAFSAAFNILLERHEILRSVFVEEAGIPKQKVLSHLPITISCFEVELDIKNEVFEHEFDLEEVPLFKVAILKRGLSHTLYFNIHHSISDGWSMGIISRDLTDIYQAAITGKIAELPNLSIQYKDYAQWQNNLLQSTEVSVQENYWKEKLAGTLPYLQLPSDSIAKLKTNDSSSSSYTVYISEDKKRKIEKISKKKRFSAFAVFVATLKILLFRLTSEEDIIIGIPVANRNHYQLKDLVGCFINTIMLRDKVNEVASFQTWLEQVNETLINALSHQNYPFEQLLELLNVPQKDNRFPLSPVFLNMIDFDAKSSEAIADFSPNHEVLEATPKFDIECYIKSFSNGYRIHCVYDNELFRKETIQYWIDAYLLIIDQIIEDDEKPLHAIKVFENYIAQEEDLKPSNDFNFFETNEIEQSIAQRFESQVAQFPNHTAVYSNGTALTYQMLNNCANHLAQQINERSNQETKRIALLLNHNETCVIGMLGVLKAGYAYVPIDSNSPLNRIQYIIEDSGCDQLVCSDSTIKKALQLQQELPQLSIVTLAENYILPEISNHEHSISASAEAYVLYTSGSTGMPKGVIQNQRNVLHFIRAYTNNVHIAINDNLSVFSTYTFDASVKDIYGAILNGATVSIYDIAENGLDRLSEWLLTQNITIIHMVPTIYRNFLKGLEEGKLLSTVRLVDLGGESCHKPDLDLFKKYFLEGAFLVNDYGPTESTIVAQKFLNHASQLTRSNMPLGNAVIETEVFLLDENNQQKGVYQSGEIVFRSDYLSLGYVNKQELTENVFITNPLTGEGRVYKSGDIGKLLATGEIEFQQRKDSQVKLNGLRIELSEIEYQLEQTESIKEAIVLLKQVQENSYITAYVRVNEAVETTKIKAQLALILPKYMIPTIYITMEEFPLTRTGKIDRKSLPNPTISNLKTKPYVAPKNDLERKLTAIWAEVLKLELEIVGTEDNFFELGGNSLQGVVLINKINKTFQTAFSIANLYETLNIRDLSALLNFSLLQNQEFEMVDQELDQDEIIL